MNKREIRARIKEIEYKLQLLREQLEKPKAEKPKLRQGDYGFMGESPRLFFVKEGELKVVCGDDDKFPCNHVKDTDRYDILGNIFDDLATMSEPLKEFEVGSGGGNHALAARIWCEKGVQFNINGFTATITNAKDVHEIILNLRRMEASQQAKENKI